MNKLSLKNIPHKNIKAHPVRTLIIAILTFAQVICVFGGMELLSGMNRELASAHARLGADLLVYPVGAFSKISTDSLLMQGTPVEVYRSRSMLDKMQYNEDIEDVSYQLYISEELPEGEKRWIIGFEPKTDFVLTPWVAEGESLDMSAGSVAVGSRVKVSEKGTVMLYGKEWPVAAHLEETGSVMDDSVFVPMMTLKEVIQASVASGDDSYAGIDPERDFSSALIRISEGKSVESVTDWINIYVRKVKAVKSEETLSRTALSIKGTTKVMMVIALLSWLVLLIALVITQTMLMKERTKEIFVWHSIGASRRLINRVFLKEAFLIHFASSAVAAFLMCLVFLIFGKHIIRGYEFAIWYELLAGTVSVGLTVVAGLAADYLTIKRAVGRLEAQMLLTV